MAQWDVYANPARWREFVPCLLVLQSDLLANLPTCWVAPVSSRGVPTGLLPSRMTPVVDIAGERLLLKPHEAGTVDAKVLRKPVALLRARSQRIVDAVDAVISGV